MSHSTTRPVQKKPYKTICLRLLFELYPGRIMLFLLENTSFSPFTLYQFPEELAQQQPLFTSAISFLLILQLPTFCGSAAPPFFNLQGLLSSNSLLSCPSCPLHLALWSRFKCYFLRKAVLCLHTETCVPATLPHHSIDNTVL